MLEFTLEKGQCTGCTACKAICPTKCISMVKDEEGFLYPQSDDSCIDCHLCEKVCPIQNPLRPHVEQKAYAAVSLDENVWKRSASGGAFSEICKAYADANTMIVGAAWNGLHLHHISVIGPSNIAPLCKSKYVASDLENVFSEIKDYLAKGNKVIFCGTPCQVAGLRAFLRKPYDKLLLIDLICHGVGSPDVFLECMDVIGEQFDCKVTSYEFRSKQFVYDTDYICSIVNQTGRRKYIMHDPYMQLFLSQKALRPSCGSNCIFRNTHRQGDLTIADFKGLYEVFPKLAGGKRNFSTIVSNNEKGDRVVKSLSTEMLLLDCSIDDIIKHNPLFDHHTWFSNGRDSFFDEARKNMRAAIKKETQPAQVYKLKFSKKIYFFLPFFMRNFVYSLVKKLRS